MVTTVLIIAYLLLLNMMAIYTLLSLCRKVDKRLKTVGPRNIHIHLCQASLGQRQPLKASIGTGIVGVDWSLALDPHPLKCYSKSKVQGCIDDR